MSELSSITSKCLTLHLNILSATIDGDDLESMVIRGEDIISLFVTSLVRTSLIHTFLTKSRSVTKPNGFPPTGYFDDLITAKIIPMIENEKLRFVAPSD